MLGGCRVQGSGFMWFLGFWAIFFKGFVHFGVFLSFAPFGGTRVVGLLGVLGFWAFRWF